MGREKRIRLSEAELQRLKDAQESDGLEELPYGAYIVRVLNDRREGR